MIPDVVVRFFAGNQEALWLTTVFIDLGGTVLLYRFFGKAGLQVAIATAIILANLQGPKLTIIFGLQTSLGVIFYSSIFFATDVLSENYGKAEANKAVRMGFVVSVIVLVMLSLALLYLPSDRPETAAYSASIHDGICHYRKLHAALCFWLSARVLREPNFRCLGFSQNQGNDGRALALAKKQRINNEFASA